MLFRYFLFLSLSIGIKCEIKSLSSSNLSFDGVVSESTLKRFTSNEFTFAEATSAKISSRLLSLWVHKNGLLRNNYEMENPHCISNKDYKRNDIGTKCLMGYSLPGFGFDISMTTYKADEDDFKQNTYTFFTLDTTVKVEISSDYSIFDASNSYATSLSRNFLLHIVEFINSSVGGTSALTPNGIWAIKERSNHFNLMGKYFASNKHKLYKDQASIESLVLTDSTKLRRIPIVTSSPNTLKVSGNNKSTVESGWPYDEGNNRTILNVNLDIWQYEDNSMGSEHLTRALFLNSSLRAINTTAGSAHAEAFVHPALISHPHPVNIAVVSEMPLAYIRELMKYDTVEHITVVGAESSLLMLAQTYMSQLNDCSFLLENNKYGSLCMEYDDVVELVESDVMVWLNNSIDIFGTKNKTKEKQREFLQFDVILLDVPSSPRNRYRHEWFTDEFHLKLQEKMSYESILVINSGSTPSKDHTLDSTIGFSNDKRHIFLSKLGKTSTSGINNNYFYEISTVYDEPIASPLDTAFFICFLYDDSVSYQRFFRSTSSQIDKDLINRLSPQSTPPTVIYDGPTHLRFARPSRDWENWYCSTGPGKSMSICNEFLGKWYNKSFHISQTEVKHVPVKGRSLYAGQYIPKGSFILSDDPGMSLHIDQLQWDVLNNFLDMFPDATMYKNFRDYVIAYGFLADNLGKTGWSVSIASNNTFTNHACSDSEHNVGHLQFPSVDGGEEITDNGFSPLVTRRAELISQLAIARKDIMKGEEMMTDYHSFQHNTDINFHDFLETICKTGVGMVKVSDNDEL